MDRLNGYCEIPISSLIKAKWNYKEDNDAKLQKLIAGIKRNGQIENIIVREVARGKFEVINGNHRYDAMVKLKRATAICFNLGKVTLPFAQRLAVETNETRFESNGRTLAKLIKDIAEEYTAIDLATTFPYDQEEIEDFVRLVDFDWSEAQKGNESNNKGDEGLHTLKFRVSESTLKLWSRYSKLVMRIDDEIKPFEFAISNALIEAKKQ